jgi:hypothetical protein
MDLLYLGRALWRPGDKLISIFDSKKSTFFHQNLDPEPDLDLYPDPVPQLEKMMDPDPH